MSVCVCVCPSASLSSQIWVNKSGRFTLQTRHSKFLHRPKRLRCHSAPLLALLRSKSRRRRATRPAAGPPTPAIAGSRARGVTKATVRPPSLLNHSRRLASCCAPRHCRLSTPSLSRSWMESGGCTRSCHERGASPLGLLFWYLWRQSLPTRLTLQGSASANTIISSRVAYF